MKSSFVIAAVVLEGLCCVSIAAAAGLPESVIECRAVGDPQLRLACYDEAVDRTELPQPVVSGATGETALPAAAGTERAAAAPARDAPAAQVEDKLSSERLFGKSGVEVRQSVQEATGAQEIDKITAIVTKVQHDASGKIVITLDNGQVWRQIDTSRIRLSKKNTVVIQRASLGSFLLSKSGSKRSVRVKRTS